MEGSRLELEYCWYRLYRRLDSFLLFDLASQH